MSIEGGSAGYPPAGEIFLNRTTLALADQDFELASQLARERMGGRFSIDFAVAQPGETPVSSVIWEAASDSSSVMSLSRELYETRSAPQIARVLVMTLPLVAAYHVAGAHERGRVPLNLDDNGTRPGLSFCANTDEPFLIPDVGFIDSRGYQSMRDHFAASHVPWDARRSVAFWRGGTSGWSTIPGWRNLARVRLCAICNRPEYGELFDVGLSNIAQISDPECVDQIRTSGLMRDFVSAGQWNNYKFQIDIDGNSNAFIGFFIRLLTGSPVLKVASEHGFRQWFYHKLVPWQHYVPVAADMSDLADKVRWLGTHQEEARAIGISGQKLAHSLDYESQMDFAAEQVAAAIRSNAARQAGISRRPQRESSFGVSGDEKHVPLAGQINRRVHGTDVYAGFVPTFAEDLQGWNGQFPPFRELVAEADARIVIDVGVWKGASTVYLAELLRERKSPGAVIAVDTFLGSLEHSVLGGELFNYIPRRHGLPLLYEQFMSNICRRELQDWVVPLAQTSATAAAILWRQGVRADLIHIDAAHEYEAVSSDIRIYWNLLRPGGIFVGDDYGESWSGVVKAADEFAAQLKLHIQVIPPKWIIRKPV